MALPTALRCTIAVTLDGTPVAGFPVERRVTGEQLYRQRYVRKADGAGTISQTLPQSILLPLATLLIEPERDVLVSLNAQAADAVTVGGGGAMLLLNAGINIVNLANPTDEASPVSLLGLTP